MAHLSAEGPIYAHDVLVQNEIAVWRAQARDGGD